MIDYDYNLYDLKIEKNLNRHTSRDKREFVKQLNSQDVSMANSSLIL